MTYAKAINAFNLNFKKYNMKGKLLVVLISLLLMIQLCRPAVLLNMESQKQPPERKLAVIAAYNERESNYKYLKHIKDLTEKIRKMRADLPNIKDYVARRTSSMKGHLSALSYNVGVNEHLNSVMADELGKLNF